jgi:hypothetical protein
MWNIAFLVIYGVLAELSAKTATIAPKTPFDLKLLKIFP